MNALGNLSMKYESIKRAVINSDVYIMPVCKYSLTSVIEKLVSILPQVVQTEFHNS